MNDYENQFELLSQISGCPIYVKNGENEQVFPMSREIYESDPLESCPFICDPKLTDLFSDQRAGRPFLKEDRDFPGVFYGGVRYEEDILIIAGPVTKKKLPVNYLMRYMKKHHISDEKNYQIKVRTFRGMANVVSLLHMLCRQEYIPPKKLIPEKNSLKKVETENEAAYTKLRLGKEEESKEHFPYQFENRMLDCIRKGEYDEANLKEIIFLPEHLTSGKLAGTERKDAEYKIVGTMTLYIRAAIDGGVNPYEAYDVGELYFQKLSQAKSIQEFNDIRQACFIHYCKLVRRAQQSADSNIHVEKCKHFIGRHISKPFTFDELVEYVGVNKSYLSRIFREEENMTVTEYIMNERITAARHMLQFSDYSPAQIASYLCFCDQSYFCKIFKKKTGVTPTKYRKLHKTSAF